MKLASLEVITKIEEIVGFDRLDLATVAGYKTVVPKNLYTVGDLVIYIRIDTVLPKTDKFESFRKYAKTRVKTARIGNSKLGFVWSQGLILSINEFDKDLGFSYKEALQHIGQDVSNQLGITKYEESSPTELNAKGKLPFGIPKTDEPNYKDRLVTNYLDDFLDVAVRIDSKTNILYYSLNVDVTLKIDGTSFTAYYDLKTDTFGVCGRTLEYKLDSNNNYTKIAKQYDLADKLRQYCISNNVSLALRGEMYGNGIQKSKNNPHCQLPLNIAFYSVYNIEEGKYEGKSSDKYFTKVCENLDLPTVDILEQNVPLTKNLMESYENIESINNHTFEGVVIKTDNISFKVINKYYDMLK